MIRTLNKINYLLDRESKKGILIVFITMVIGGGAELLGVSVLIPLVNIIMDPNVMKNTRWGKTICSIFSITDYRIFSMVLIAGVCILYVIKNAYIIFMYKVLYYFTYSNKRRVVQRLFRCYINREYEFHLNKNVAEMERDIATDTGLFFELISNVLSIGNEIIICLFLVIYLLITDWIITVLVIAVLGFSLLFFYRIQKKVQSQRGRENRIAVATATKWMLQTFYGIKDTKILGRENFFIKKYNEAYYRGQEANRKNNLATLYPKPIMETICVVSFLLVLGIRLLLNSDTKNMTGILAVFAIASFKLLPSFNKISAYFAAIMFEKESLHALYSHIKEAEEFDKNPRIKSTIDGNISFEKEIRIDNLYFHYKDSEDNVLSGVNLVIKKGESIALIGESGSGKSTLADLILGLLIPQNGKISVDGRNIIDYIGGWRKLIGYIPQSIYLMDDTIRNNVAYGISENEIDDDRIWEVLSKAQLDDFVRSLDDGLDSIVGESGARISGGQRQRLGIARALYTNPEILVFDEATSALDNETEADLMCAIEGLIGTKTIIIIAHRLNTIRNCDKIFEIRDGKANYIIKEKLSI